MDKNLTEIIDFDTANKMKIIPIKSSSEKISILSKNPLKSEEQNYIENISKLEVEIIKDKRKNFEKLFEETYNICQQVNSFKEEFIKLEYKNNIAVLAEFIFVSSIKLKASDIHITGEKEKIIVKFRVDGILRTFIYLKLEEGELLVRYIKIKSNIDISRTVRPLEGRFSWELYGENMDFRISIIPTIYGEKITVRLLGMKENIFLLEDIGFSFEEIEIIKRRINTTSGFVLLCGPTGSGKSTTLFAILNAINNGQRNIVSIEDPVEYYMDGVTQIDISKEKNMEFYSTLKFVLRQDPDIITIGEIRDFETADTSLKASITGHLVFSTVHTKSSIGVLERLIDLGVKPYIVANAVSLIISQRLIRKLCESCKTKQSSSALELDCFNIPIGTTIFEAVGCEKCYGTGYKGRMPIFEILEIDDQIKGFIKNRDLKPLRSSIIPLKEKIKNTIIDGGTSFAEGYKYI